jgi:hypothetical protein
LKAHVILAKYFEGSRLDPGTRPAIDSHVECPKDLAPMGGKFVTCGPAEIRVSTASEAAVETRFNWEKPENP